jgi:hypothetical protein
VAMPRRSTMPLTDGSHTHRHTQVYSCFNRRLVRQSTMYESRGATLPKGAPGAPSTYLTLQLTR